MWYSIPTMNAREELAAIVERLSSIQRTIEDYGKTEDKERNRQREREDIPKQVTGIFRLPEAIETQRAADQERYHTTQKLIALAAWAAFLAASVYAGLAYLQWREMITATDAAADAVHESRLNRQQSQQSFKATIDQFQLDQRAWIIFRGIGPKPEIDKPWNLEVHFTNTGKTPARNVRMSCNFVASVTEEHWPKEIPLGLPSLITPNEDSLCVLKVLKIPKMDQTTLDQIARMDFVMFVHGWVDYLDVFGHEHWLTFCRSMRPDGEGWDQCKTRQDDTGDGPKRY